MNGETIIVLVVIAGYISNTLNWKYLNYRFTYVLYCLGTLVHETSHALLCLFTGAHIETFKVFSRQPHVIHRKSKLPVIGELLISVAPIVGGLICVYIINHLLLGNHFTIPFISNVHAIPESLLTVFSQINLLQWQSWVLILLFINMGAMIGPSFQDIKNIWPLLIVLIFVSYPPLISLALTALSFICINILIQIILIGLMWTWKRLRIFA